MGFFLWRRSTHRSKWLLQANRHPYNTRVKIIQVVKAIVLLFGDDAHCLALDRYHISFFRRVSLIRSKMGGEIRMIRR